MPAVFAYGGRRLIAHRTLAQFAKRFMADGKFSVVDDPIANPWTAYIGGWLAWGAGALGRFDVARAVVSAIAYQQDAKAGGFWHEHGGRRLFDTERTSAAAMGCVWAMDTPRAEAASRFLAMVLDAQKESQPPARRPEANANKPDAFTFYAYSDWNGRPIVDRSDRNAYFATDDPHARPALFATTVACLVWVARQTGRRDPLETAHDYMRIVLAHHHDAAALPLATKSGWAAMMLHAHAPAAQLRDFARRNADHILSGKSPTVASASMTSSTCLGRWIASGWSAGDAIAC
jgi:hypothetical protein